MNKKIILTTLAFLIVKLIFGQVYYSPIGAIGSAIMPEHGFLPGKNFKYYSTINKYNLEGKTYRIEVYDERQKVKLRKIQCSETEFTNTSEFETPNCIYKFGQYVDTLLTQSNAKLDLSSIDTIQIKLEGIDARMIGFGYIRAHGLCQIKVKYHNLIKTYCIDITDTDKNSPISPNAFVTRKTATRIIASAAMREVIELFIADIKNYP